jgi:carboxyl-terminal processing protease
MPKALKLFILAISVVLIVFVFLGGFVPGGVSAGSDSNAYRQIEVYSEVLQHIQSDYVVSPDIPAVTDGALHGLLEGLDPNSGYLSPAEYKLYESSKNQPKAQIGINVSKRYGSATVISVVPGSPADKAGIVAGDIIDTIGKKGTRVMPLQMIDLALDGAPGSSVSFSVVEPTSATPDEMTLTRRMRAYPALGVSEYENGSILYLKPYELQKQRVDELLTRIAQAQKSGPKKILLDLRDVTGGSMDAAVHLANAFLKSGTIATLEGQRYSKKSWTANAKKFVTGDPLVVLVNHGTAGPAEIVAAALKDNNRAQLVGDRTFGSGSVQKEIPMPDGAMLFLTVALYHSPDGNIIQDTAVNPNVTVAENNGVGLVAPPVSPGTVTKPTAPRKAEQKNAPKAAPEPQPDDQLDKALQLLKGQKAA